MDLNFLRVLPYCAFGALLAAAYFSALSWNVRLYVGGGTGWNALLVHLLRLLVIVAVFTLCARQGVSSLLLSVLGFELMRKVAVNRQILALGGKS